MFIYVMRETGSNIAFPLQRITNTEYCVPIMLPMESNPNIQFYIMSALPILNLQTSIDTALLRFVYQILSSAIFVYL